MKRRRIPAVETLEARETPDVSLGPAVVCPHPSTEGAPVCNTAAGSAETQEQPAFSVPAVESFFADTAELAKLLAPSHQLAESELPVLSPTAAEMVGWQFLSNYTQKAIRNEELRYGRLPDHEDLVHQVFVAWREQVGPSVDGYSNLLNPDSSEHEVLRKSVRRVLDHARYEQRRDRRAVDLPDQPAAPDPAEQEWLDLQIDLSQGIGNAGPRERQLWELRRQGLTFEEIGAELGLVRQRVHEVYTTLIGRLQALYAE